ncbi:MAG: hypothetical protein MI685_00945 [Chlorobiales bacterium]|nr:hypothetical protein [Chlorobiales bacterium]
MQFVVLILLAGLIIIPGEKVEASPGMNDPEPGRKSVSVEFFGGASFSLPIMPLTLKQDGYDDISFTAHYETKPFDKHPYYAYRLGRWVDGKAWEIELVHHKIHLTNNPAEVQHFEVSHGYNLLTVNRAWDTRHLIYRVGLGLVIAHPESTVRNKPFYEMDGGFKGDGNYYVAGPTAQFAVQKNLSIWKSLYLAGEAKLTASYATVPIAEGDAVAPNTALHLLLGLGIDL